MPLDHLLRYIGWVAASVSLIIMTSITASLDAFNQYAAKEVEDLRKLYDDQTDKVSLYYAERKQLGECSTALQSVSEKISNAELEDRRNVLKDWRASLDRRGLPEVTWLNSAAQTTCDRLLNKSRELGLPESEALSYHPQIVAFATGLSSHEASLRCQQ